MGAGTAFKNIGEWTHYLMDPDWDGNMAKTNFLALFDAPVPEQRGTHLLCPYYSTRTCQNSAARVGVVLCSVVPR